MTSYSTETQGGKIYTAAIIFLTLTYLMLPVATSLLSAFSLFTLLLWLFSGKLNRLPLLLKVNPVALFSALLFLLFIAGITYSSATLSESMASLKKYRELILIPIFMTLLAGNMRARLRCESAFIAGMIILLIISYGMALSIIPSARYGNSILYHITHNFFMSILAFYAAHRATDAIQIKRRLIWGAVFLLCVINMFYLAPGRTGMVIFFLLMILFFAQRLSLIKQGICFTLFAVLLILAFFTSENFNSRSRLAVQEIQAYEYGSSRTSLGMRFDWWLNSIDIIKQSPIWGHGTGSFTTEHDKYIDKTKMVSTDNPHNEYLFIGVQLGGIGLAIYMLIFLLQLFYSFRLDRPDRFLAQGMVVSMAAGCIMNSFLFDSHQGHFWALLSAVYYADLHSE